MKTLNTNIAKIRDKNNNWSSIPALKGESAYELAVKKGFEGSEDDFNNSLVKKEEIDKINENINLLLNKSIKNEIIDNASGSNIIIEDSSEQESLKDCKIYGWSKQDTTTGAQLFPTITPSIEEKNGITVEHMEHGKIHISGTAEKMVEFVTPTFELLAGTYTLSMGVNIDNTLMRCTLSTAEGLPYFDILNNEASKTETIKDNMILYLLLRVYGGKTIDITIQPMLNTGTSPLPWEPYTGGQPSPSLEYPQEIISAGSDGKVGMEVRGKNLFDFSRLVSDGVNVMDYEKQTITVPAKTNNTGYNQTLRDLCPGITPGTYVFSMKRSNPNSGNGSYFLEATKDFPINTPIELTGELLDNHISWYNSDTSEVENVISEIQIEKGNVVTSYEPYHEPQSLSISTPTGLPAIPVGTGGNYTDANGQQWVCDEVDLERGVKVQRVNRLKLDDLSWGHELTQINKNDSFISDVPASQCGTMRGDSLCQYAVFSGVNYDAEMTESSRCYVWTKVATIQFKAGSSVNSLDAFSEWLKAHPDASISYCLAVPIKTTLTPEEIQAYKNLVTYAGTTILENDADCYMKLGYVADPKAYIDKKFSELSAAIIASSSEAE